MEGKRRISTYEEALDEDVVPNAAELLRFTNIVEEYVELGLPQKNSGNIRPKSFEPVGHGRSRSRQSSPLTVPISTGSSSKRTDLTPIRNRAHLPLTEERLSSVSPLKKSHTSISIRRSSPVSSISDNHPRRDSSAAPNSISKISPESLAATAIRPNFDKSRVANCPCRSSRTKEHINDREGTIPTPPIVKHDSRPTRQTNGQTKSETIPQDIVKKPRAESSKAPQESKIIVEQVKEPSRGQSGIVIYETSLDVGESEGSVHDGGDADDSARGYDPEEGYLGRVYSPWRAVGAFTGTHPKGWRERRQRNKSPQDH